MNSATTLRLGPCTFDRPSSFQKESAALSRSRRDASPLSSGGWGAKRSEAGPRARFELMMLAVLDYRVRTPIRKWRAYPIKSSKSTGNASGKPLSQVDFTTDRVESSEICPCGEACDPFSTERRRRCVGLMVHGRGPRPPPQPPGRGRCTPRAMLQPNTACRVLTRTETQRDSPQAENKNAPTGRTGRGELIIAASRQAMFAKKRNRLGSMLPGTCTGVLPTAQAGCLRPTIERSL
jgi:hypothetical protein